LNQCVNLIAHDHGNQNGLALFLVHFKFVIQFGGYLFPETRSLDLTGKVIKKRLFLIWKLRNPQVARSVGA